MSAHRPSKRKRKWPAWSMTAVWVGAVVLGLYVVLRILQDPVPRPPQASGEGGGKPGGQAPGGVNRSPAGRPDPAEGTVAEVRFDDFVGSEACAECHREQYEPWRRSTHGLAGGDPGYVPIIARFDGQPLRFSDGVVTPTRGPAGEYLFKVEQEGLPKLEIEVSATVGAGHMYGGGTQTFFEEFPDGTVRFLPFDYIRDEDLWFVQLARDSSWAPVSEAISLRTDLANWPPRRVLGTLVEFSNCQNCHGSQIMASYDVSARRYRTRYHSLSINCESCHGPGRRHVEIVGQPGFREKEDIGMRPLSVLSRDESLQVCFQCHATKDVLQEAPYLPGMPLEDHFSLKFPIIANNPFHLDGRVKGFGYQLNHLFSDCYVNGSMTCVDCHDPHSQGYRDVFRRPLRGKFDDRQCTSCHASKAQDPRSHTHHAPGTPGSRCVDCHMPFLQHQAVGDLLSFERSDHTIPIPRPAADASLGIENACQKCHQDQGLEWQQRWVTQWYGEIKPRHPMIERLMAAEQTDDPDQAARLLLVPGSDHRMGQMAGLATFTRRYLCDPAAGVASGTDTQLMALAASPDLDVRGLALAALHVGFGAEPRVSLFLENQLNRLAPNESALRHRWSIAADYIGELRQQNGDLPGAIRAFEKSLSIVPDNIVSLSHLAFARMAQGETELAEQAMRRAIEARPHQARLHFQLAQMQVQQRKFKEAIASLQRGMEYAPNDARAQMMLRQLRSLPGP